MGKWPDHYRFKFSGLPENRGFKRFKRGSGGSFEPFETAPQGVISKNTAFQASSEKHEMNFVYQEKNHG